MGNYHYWGDEDFDWKALTEAERLLRKILKIGRIGVHSKEKYGTLRVSCYFFRGSLHDLLYPGYMYCQYKTFRDKRWYLDIYFWPKVFQYTGLTRLMNLYQRGVYTLAYYIVMKKYSHIKEEICVDADVPEWIIGGQEIHDKYWTKL